MSEPVKKPGWREIPESDVLAPGTADKFHTGGWRSEKPRWIPETCIQCMICWIACPDVSVTTKDGKMTGFDFDHCKGCGICAFECPTKPKSIVMEPEKK